MPTMPIWPSEIKHTISHYIGDSYVLNIMAWQNYRQLQMYPHEWALFYLRKVPVLYGCCNKPMQR